MLKARTKTAAALFLFIATLLIPGGSPLAQGQGAGQVKGFTGEQLHYLTFNQGERAGSTPPPWVKSLEPEHMGGILLIAEALSWQSVPYRLGGESRDGVDCSGFVRAVLGAALPSRAPFPRTSEGFAGFGREVSLIEPGDILIFTEEGRAFHVGIALSAASFIHAASDGPRRGVIISNLDEAYWAGRLGGIRRIEY
jgi:probable lipoprotein NlpC